MQNIILIMLFILLSVDTAKTYNQKIFIKHKKNNTKKNNTKTNNELIKDIQWGGVENLINWPL